MTPSKRLPTMRPARLSRMAANPIWQAELAASNDRALRLHAEMQNLRTARRAKSPTNANTPPCPCSAICCGRRQHRSRDEAAEKAGGAEKLVEGFRLVRQQLAVALSSNSCVLDRSRRPDIRSEHSQAILHQPSVDVPAGSVNNGHATRL